MTSSASAITQDQETYEPTTILQMGRPLVICLLGEFEVRKEGTPVAMRRGGKSEALLAMLALQVSGSYTRDALEASLWPSAPPGLAHQSLNSLIHTLYKLLADCLRGASPILNRGGAYCLNSNAGIGVDVRDFESLARIGDAQVASGRPREAADVFKRAVALYRGDLQAGEDVRAATERERLRARFLGLLAHLASYDFELGKYAVAQSGAQRLLAHEPCREDAHRLAMRCYARLGERAQALRQYRLCEWVLTAEFDAVPEAATTELFDRIRLDPGGV